jgi:hypothetical protein
MRDGGKGDKPRPLNIPIEEFDKNFESIFKEKANKPQPNIEPIPFAGLVDTGEDTDTKAQEK